MQLIARSIALAYSNLPRPHRIMLGSLTVVTLAVAVWKPLAYHPDNDLSDTKPLVKNITLDNQQLRSLLPEASEPIDQSPLPMMTFRKMILTIKQSMKPAYMNMWFLPAIR